MTYELIGNPRIETEYSDQYETVMVCDLKRDDGVTGDVWIVAGVPAQHVGSSNAAGHQYGFQSVRVFGDSPSMWCPESFRPIEEPDTYSYADVAEAVVEACRAAALATHNEARQTAPSVSPFFAGVEGI
jgi:hypothetical protein